MFVKWHQGSILLSWIWQKHLTELAKAPAFAPLVSSGALLVWPEAEIAFVLSSSNPPLPSRRKHQPAAVAILHGAAVKLSQQAMPVPDWILYCQEMLQLAACATTPPIHRHSLLEQSQGSDKAVMP